MVRRGMATRLMEVALKYLKESRCALVLAEAGEENAGSTGFLGKLGFNERGRLVNFMKEV